MTKALLISTAVLTLAVAGPALADGGKTMPGRCFAAVDGKTKADNVPCDIQLEVGGGFEFTPLNDTFRVVPDREDGTATGDGTGVWTVFDPRARKNITRQLGTLERDGACWTNDRAKICAWNGAAETRKNREAPYTAFHALIGKDVPARCHMGECEWFRLESATLVGHNAHEALYRLKLRSWTTADKDEDRNEPRADETVGNVVMRCSRTRPAMVVEDGKGDGVTVSAFDPRDELSAYGASEVANVEYAAACHAKGDLMTGPEAALLGYEKTGDADSEARIASLQEALQ